MCDCINRVNAILAPHNTVLAVPFWSSSGLLTPLVETCKLDASKRGKPKAMFANYCPFCGEKYTTTVAEQRQEAAVNE
jgi:hypothetical protein